MVKVTQGKIHFYQGSSGLSLEPEVLAAALTQAKDARLTSGDTGSNPVRGTKKLSPSLLEAATARTTTSGLGPEAMTAYRNIAPDTLRCQRFGPKPQLTDSARREHASPNAGRIGALAQSDGLPLVLTEAASP